MTGALGGDAAIGNMGAPHKRKGEPNPVRGGVARRHKTCPVCLSADITG
jgi:hypothetical protein